MDKKLIVEIATGKLVNGTDEQKFMEAAQTLQDEFLEQQPGYISRVFFKGEDGVWGDIVHWRSLEEAQQAKNVALENPVCKSYFSMFDPDSIKVIHAEVIRKY